MKFLWGSATASYQCEGAWNIDGKGLSNWDDFFHNTERGKDLVSGDEACDFYHHYEEDIRMMKESNQNTLRLSLSWPRIIPNGTGEVNPKGVEFYHKVFKCCKDNGIEPMVTLYHWDLPITLDKKGGWLNFETADAFKDYARFCFEEFGDEVKLWATLNEPYYSLQCMYGVGNYPPNEKDGNKFCKAGYIQMLASAKAVIEFKKFKDIGTIGLVADIHPCNGVDDSRECREAVRKADNIMNNWVLDTAINGYFPQDLIEDLKDYYDLSFIREEDKEIFMNGTVDYIGLNYYNRSLIRPYTGGETQIRVNNSGKRNDGVEIKDGVKRMMVVKDMFEKIADPNGEWTEWDFEIYPDGMYEVLMEMKYKYHNIPTYITENGIGIREEKNEKGEIEDDGRIDFVKRHVEQLIKAKKEGADVRGYYMWSTMDLYSWINGWVKRYGLVYVDFEKPEMPRTPKKSFYWYKNFIEENKDI